MRASVLVCWFTLLISASLHAQLADFNAIDFKKADSVAALYPNHPLKNLKLLSDKLTTPFVKQGEKFRAIYTWVCTNIENDYPLYLTIKHKREKLINQPKELREWNKKIGKQVFDKLRQEQKTICTGYAYLIRELATHAGLNSVIVDGYGRTSQSNIGGVGVANHSWNAVQLNNGWYLCDATWSSGAVDTQLGVFIKKYNDVYFLADPSLFLRNHYPLDSAWMLVKAKPTLQQFLNGPIVYSSTYQHQIKKFFPEKFDIVASKGVPIEIGFSTEDKQTVTKIELEVAGSNFKYCCEVKKSANNQFSLHHTFKARGTFILHVLIDSQHSFSYRVRVV
jgi:transglutaminase/protease-like cytokinesis protein 3